MRSVVSRIVIEGWAGPAGVVKALSALAVTPLGSAGAFTSNPWADAIIAYDQGSNPVGGFTDPAAALGIPTRFTGEGVFPSAVTPFSPPYLPDEIVSIGAGGSLIVAFDKPVTDDPLNPFGVDLLLFGNSFFLDFDYPNGLAGGFQGEHGQIAVSQDGSTWFDVAPSGVFPSLGYLDLATPYADQPGLADSDFTRPVDPTFDPIGRTFSEIVAAYQGSGGGVGFDLASSGLGQVRFVRVSNPVGAGSAVEIDAMSDVSPVPAPGFVVIAGATCLTATRRARRTDRKRSAPLERREIHRVESRPG